MASNPWTSKDIVEINHCLRGSFSGRFCDGRNVKLQEGDLAINMLEHQVAESFFPDGQYQGVSLLVDVTKVMQGLQVFPPSVLVDVPALLQSLCAPKGYVQVKASAELQRIFADLYVLSTDTHQGLCLLKVLELFLFLHQLKIALPVQSASLSSNHQALLERVETYLSTERERKVPVCELCNRFAISRTSLKEGFKYLYGCPIGSYHKTLRIQEAARLLRTSSMSITTIAGVVGYDNPSKFASAFRTVMELSPSEYRKVHLERTPVQME
jgi:AraC-like DNA-binding protein